MTIGDHAVSASLMTYTVRASSEGISNPTPVHYEAGFIFLSYVISCVGCMSALELLHRRTSVRGAFNWYLLIASSWAMGGVGIWSMHFLGNRAIILADGASDRQLSYNQGFTALSFFLPIMVLVIAFYVLAISGTASNFHIFIAGLLTGTAVCAMHYVGQVGIDNYDCTYELGNIIGAAIIAVVASLVALSVFFRLRNTWTDSWWKRGICACILAGAVSGMHWTAAVGTNYTLRPDAMGRGTGTRVQTVIVCAFLSIVSCTILLAIAFLTRRRALERRQRAQELVLACVYFDEDDRVMVSSDGFLPYQKITSQFIQKTFGEDELSRSHPAFMWVYEASRNWRTLLDLVPGMQEQLDADPIARRYQPGYEASMDISRSGSVDFDAIFKQLFCVAAEKLAGHIHEPMEELGVMFEEPLETGTMLPAKAIKDRLLEKHDVEKTGSPKVFGNGRYLFLNRRLNKAEAEDFAARGYRFGSGIHVAESLARNMQVSQEDILARLERMRICISKEHLHPAGIHLAAFLLRPNIQTGFDVLVPTISQNQLPLVTLPINEVTPGRMELLQSFDEWTVRDILKELLPEQIGISDRAKDFRWQLYTAFVKLADTVNDSVAMMDAKFSARPVSAPCRSPQGSNKSGNCLIFSVRYLGSIHSTYTQRDLTYVPFDFFNAQQQVESCEARHEVFSKRAHREFGHILRLAQTKSQTQSVHASENGGHRTPLKFTSEILESALSGLGVKSTKISRTSSRSAILNSVGSGRSTAEPEARTPSPPMKKHSNSSKEGVSEKTPAELTSPRPLKQARSNISDESELIALTDDRRTFVSELFTLFRLSEKPKIPNLG